MNEGLGILGRFDDGFGEFLGAFAALRKAVANREAAAEFGDARADHFDFFVRVGVEVVERHDDVRAEVLEVLNVGVEVDETLLQGFDVGLADFGERHSAVPFEGLGRSDEHHRGGGEARGAALDVEELFGAEVGTEARFRDGVVAELERGARGDDRVAAVGDVREGAPVHEGGVAFDRLHEVGLHGVLEERDEGARAAEFLHRAGRAVAAKADDDAVDAVAKVREVGRKAEDRHEFGGGRDVKARFGRNPVGGAAEARDDVAKHAVVHVHDAAPEDFAQFDLALMTGVVDDGGEKVVRRRDRVEVPREVEVDRFHREDLAVAAARGAALHAEDGAERRFAKGEDGVLADFLHPLGERDRGRGLAGTRGHAGGGRHENEAALFLAVGAERDLGLVAAVGFEFGFGEADFRREFRNGLERSCLSNFDVAEHGNTPKR